MICFFQKSTREFFVLDSSRPILSNDLNKLSWLFSGARLLDVSCLEGEFMGPGKEMITPWSTNVTDIIQNAGISYIRRVERFIKPDRSYEVDPMLERRYRTLDQKVFEPEHRREGIIAVKNIAEFNEREGLALSDDEVEFLRGVAAKTGRPLTDSEVFGFSQINSEHCRHKIFNGLFMIDGKRQEQTLFQWIKKTSKENPNFIVSAYRDNVAFVKGPTVEQFAPQSQDKADYFETKHFNSVISLKAETHNFPTTVEPFNGAATGAGGEIRDRMAGGQGSIPLAGTAVYMTDYPRTAGDRNFEKNISERNWLYRSPKDILVKASNGASDFGNKFGQPLITGSLLTFEHRENEEIIAYDKVVMLAGGVGFAKPSQSLKKQVSAGKKIVVMGGDNYRIGMGGGAVSSVNTGQYENAVELNAVQRSNPEMQKRVANAVRAMVEPDENPVISIHDHGAGGHLNCLAELVEDTGGRIDMRKLPLGDPTLSDKEILGNESQERMGLVIAEEDLNYLKKAAKRERAPLYEAGITGSDKILEFYSEGASPFRLKLEHLFGSSPRTVIEDKTIHKTFEEPVVEDDNIHHYLTDVLQLEAVACKDWLTNKVDRSVTGKVAAQQTVGEIQLPLNNVGVVAMDFKSNRGIATSIGHAPVPALIDPGAGSRLSAAEALTNIVFAPLTHGLRGVSLSANWMWPAGNAGEYARLYQAVSELSEFVIELGINIPTGKDSLSMTQKYPDGQRVLAPGTVVISAVAEVSDIRKVVLPAADASREDSKIIYIPFSSPDWALGGSSLSQSLGRLGNKTPDADTKTIKRAFEAVQHLIDAGQVIAGHDVSSGGLITTLLEMNFPNTRGGFSIDISVFGSPTAHVLFSEKPAVVLQVPQEALKTLDDYETDRYVLGRVTNRRQLVIANGGSVLTFDIESLRDQWMKSSHLLDLHQTEKSHALKRFANYKNQPLSYRFPAGFSGKAADFNIDFNRKTSSGIRAAVIREQGVNGDREMAYALYMAGFDVKDVHMTDLISGEEDLSEMNMIVFAGGFSNSDVLGSARGWAGSFLFNRKAKRALDNFYAREDTLSLGVCNGCQLMTVLEVVYPTLVNHPTMHRNGSGKFESAFVNVDIPENNTVMLGNMAGSRLGIWVAHGEGRFVPGNVEELRIPMTYAYDTFPGNPNGSAYSAAALASVDGRHLAMMPHPERTLFPWNWAHYNRKTAHEISPWAIPFANAFEWAKNH